MVSCSLALAARALAGHEHHDHVATVLLREELHATDVVDCFSHPVEDPTPQLRMLHLASTEHDRDLDLAAISEELLDLAGLGVEVAGTDLGPVLHLLDHHVCRLLTRLLGPLGLFVLELPVVHDPAHRWIGLVGHLHEVQAQIAGDGEGVGQGTYAELLSIWGDQTYTLGTDAVVDPWFLTAWRCY